MPEDCCCRHAVPMCPTSSLVPGACSPMWACHRTGRCLTPIAVACQSALFPLEPPQSGAARSLTLSRASQYSPNLIPIQLLPQPPQLPLQLHFSWAAHCTPAVSLRLPRTVPGTQTLALCRTHSSKHRPASFTLPTNPSTSLPLLPAHLLHTAP